MGGRAGGSIGAEEVTVWCNKKGQRAVQHRSIVRAAAQRRCQERRPPPAGVHLRAAAQQLAVVVGRQKMKFSFGFGCLLLAPVYSSVLGTILTLFPYWRFCRLMTLRTPAAPAARENALLVPIPKSPPLKLQPKSEPTPLQSSKHTQLGLEEVE